MKPFRLWIAVPSVIAALLLAIPLPADHGAAAFDVTKMMTVKGMVTEFQYVNPHVQVYFDAKNDKGEPGSWKGKLTASNKLSRGYGTTLPVPPPHGCRSIRSR